MVAHFYKNPANNYVEQGSGTFSWLLCLLFGPFYFAVKGIWKHVILWVALYMVRAGLFGGAFSPGLWLQK